MHLPWCVRKCPYCDFNSHALRDDLPEDAYLDALLADLDDEAARVSGREVHALFFGGGTPSLFSANAIGRVLDRAAARLKLSGDCEVTLEANPGTAEAARFAGYRAAGVNRLSIGVQSFDDSMLQKLGRIHDGAAAMRALEMARTAGFDRINLDLMHGLPGQSLDGAVADMRRALAFDPGHVSHYQLTIEPNTAFHADPPVLPDDDTLWTIQEACHAELVQAGYQQYEVSAWARPGDECRHNLNYWRFGDYLGIGAGAHGKLTDADGTTMRGWKKRHPTAWTEGAGERTEGAAKLDPQTRMFEFLLNALRLRNGFTEDEFHERTGRQINEVADSLNAAGARGLLENQGNRWRASELGWRFLNDLQAMFLPETGPSSDPYSQ